MNKAELIDAIAADTKLTKKDVDAVVQRKKKQFPRKTHKKLPQILSIR